MHESCSTEQKKNLSRREAISLSSSPISTCSFVSGPFVKFYVLPLSYVFKEFLEIVSNNYRYSFFILAFTLSYGSLPFLSLLMSSW